MTGRTINDQTGGRPRAKTALQESEERFQAAFERAPIGMAIIGLDFQIQRVNPELARLLGYSQSELRTRTFLDLTHPDDIEKDIELSRRLVHGEVENYQLEKRFLSKSGRVICGNLSMTIVRDPQGEASYALAMLEDRTERKRIIELLTQAMPQQDQRLTAMVCALPAHVVVLGGDGVIIDASESGEFSDQTRPSILQCSALGVNYLDLCGKAAAEGNLFAQEALSGIRTVMMNHAAEFNLEYPCHSPTQRRWYLMQIDPMPRDHGGVVISHTNITDRKLAEEELHNLMLNVQQLKDRFQAEKIELPEAIKRLHDFGQIIGQSDPLKNVLIQVQQVAPTDTAVLINGETGTGKELVAHAIHALSLRRNHPLIKVNCAALQPTLIESELFGHEKGAFTGAGTSRIGRFELANKATIFLDEIGELPLELQAKLLRVLQEGEFERLGSSRTIKIDVRVIAATNRDLKEASRNGSFRADLYYRLSVFPIRIPPLRERQEDIPPLVNFFVRQISQRLGKQIDALPTATLQALRAYPWPGNVRELKNIIERAVIITPDGRLRLLDDLRVGHSAPLKASAAVEEPATEPCPRTARLEEVEREYILQVLEQTYWRIEGSHGAAGILGLNPGTLRSRMKKLGIQRPKFKS
ncbi:MAG TPA: sigma 54-interacting transcriptional regulator [Blastocatellia bacterium]|nr:sigma 54-interacting transcriptional regulator [Blastocatellia bacterium]